MTEEELSRTLLASGTTGVDAVTKLESRLEKEMAEVFKRPAAIRKSINSSKSCGKEKAN
nr:hypothetical protein [Planococcus glaciei]